MGETGPRTHTALAMTMAIAVWGCSGDVSSGANGVGSNDAGPEAAEDHAAPHFEIDPQRVYDDVAVLSSDDFEGRLAGASGGEKALRFVESLFEDLGLRPMGVSRFRQPFPFLQWMETSPARLTLDGVALTENQDFMLLMYSGAGEVSGELVFVGYGLTVPPFSPSEYPRCPFNPAGYDDYAGVDVAGKIAVVLRHGPAENQTIGADCPGNSAAKGPSELLHFGYKSANAKLHGASAMLLVQDYRHDVGPILGNIGIPYYLADLPCVSVRRDILESVVPDLQARSAAIDASLQPNSAANGRNATLTLQTEAHSTEVSNLIGAVEGVDPVLKSEVVIVGAHFDHVGKGPTGITYPGADDNASGTAVMMELARAVVRGNIQPRRTIVFAGFNSEESGMVGSCYYVGSPRYAIGQTKAMISVDMVGAGDGTGLVLFGAAEPSSQWMATLMLGAKNEQGLAYDVRAEQASGASDDMCFAQAGVPAFLASTIGPHPSYHAPDDDLANIGKANLEASVRLLWAALRPLLSGDENRYFP